MRKTLIWWGVAHDGEVGEENILFPTLELAWTQGVTMKTTQKHRTEETGVIRSQGSAPSWRNMKQIRASNWAQALVRRQEGQSECLRDE